MSHDTSARIANWCPRCGNELSFFATRHVRRSPDEDIYVCGHCGKGVGNPRAESRQIDHTGVVTTHTDGA